MKKWLALITLSMAMFIIVIDTTIMNVSISALIIDLDTSVSGIQGAISIYALVMASFILIGGKLGDILGKKRTFLIGTVLFGIGTFTASISPSLGVLIIGWSLVEGLGSALMLPNIQTMLRDEYQGKDLAFAYSMISAIGAVAAALGPIAGGYLTTFYTWRWAFFLEVLIVIAVLALSRSIKADVPLSRKPKFDLAGASLSVMGLFSIVMGILLGRTYGFWLSRQPLVIGSWEIAPFGLSVTPILAGLGVLLIMLLFRWEKLQEEKGGDGLFKPSLFSVPGLMPGFVVRNLQMAITAAFLFTFPLLLQLTFEFSAIETGIALLPFSISLLVSAIIGARLTARFIAKRIIQAGFMLVILGLGIVAWTVKPDVQPSDLGLAVIFGIGVGLIASQILNLVFSSVDEKDIPETSGLNGTFEQLGNSIGVALVGTIMLSTLFVGLQADIEESVEIPPEYKPRLLAAIENGVELVSDTQLESALEASSADASFQAEALDVYALNRTRAFKVGIIFLIFLSLVGLVSTVGLSDRKLVER
jgi:MFS family permease